MGRLSARLAGQQRVHLYRLRQGGQEMINSSEHPSRRHVIRSLFAASPLLSGVMSEMLAADAAPDASDPLAPKAPHFPAKAKRVIMLYMTGGVSHVDSFDPKP